MGGAAARRGADESGRDTLRSTPPATASGPAPEPVKLGDLLLRCRIDALPHVIDNSEGLPVRDIIHRESGDADIVFLGLREPPPGEEAAYAERLAELVGELPTVVLVRAAGPFAGLLLETDDAVLKPVSGTTGGDA